METLNYHFAGEESLDSPALVYHEDIIEANIDKALALAGGPERMWPHVKTFKAPAVVRLLQKRGIRRFKCATIAEAEMCARCGAEHILLSYPLVGPAIPRFAALRRRYAGSLFWALGDDMDQLALLGGAVPAGDPLPLLIDVNTGMDRTGVGMDRLEAFSLRAGKIPGLRVMGFHCYDGHLALKDSGARQEAAAAELEQVLALRKSLEARGLELPVLVMGGTPTFPCHARRPEAFLSPGTAFVQDRGYQIKYPDLPFIPAAAVMARVISRPRQDLFTLDLGYKAVAADQEGERGAVTDLPQARTETHSEEHWVFRAGPGPCPPVGAILHVVPTHICPTTALYPGIHVVREGRLVNYWDVEARSRKILI